MKAAGAGGWMLVGLMLYTDPMGVHYNEAARLTNNMFSKAWQQACVGVFVHLQVWGWSDAEVLINKCINAGRVRWERDGGEENIGLRAQWSRKVTVQPAITRTAWAFQSPPLLGFLLWVKRRRKQTRRGLQLVLNPCSEVLLSESFLCSAFLLLLSSTFF